MTKLITVKSSSNCGRRSVLSTSISMFKRRPVFWTIYLLFLNKYDKSVRQKNRKETTLYNKKTYIHQYVSKECLHRVDTRVPSWNRFSIFNGTWPRISNALEEIPLIGETKQDITFLGDQSRPCSEREILTHEKLIPLVPHRGCTPATKLGHPTPSRD